MADAEPWQTKEVGESPGCILAMIIIILCLLLDSIFAGLVMVMTSTLLFCCKNKQKNAQNKKKRLKKKPLLITHDGISEKFSPEEWISSLLQQLQVSLALWIWVWEAECELIHVLFFVESMAYREDVVTVVIRRLEVVDVLARDSLPKFGYLNLFLKKFFTWNIKNVLTT